MTVQTHYTTDQLTERRAGLASIEAEVPDAASTPASAPRWENPAGKADFGARMTQLARHASRLGYEVVDFAGFIEELDSRSARQIAALAQMRANAEDVEAVNHVIADLAGGMQDASHVTTDIVRASEQRVHTASSQSDAVINHIGTIVTQMGDVLGALRQVQTNNTNISEIAVNVKMLAINARIEATRAGDAGAGFATIAHAINDLAVLTTETAKSIKEGVSELTTTVKRLSDESETVFANANQVLEDNRKTNADLTRISEAMSQLRQHSDEIPDQISRASSATDRLGPTVVEVASSVGDTSERISGIRKRASTLVDHTEAIVQDTVLLGGASEDRLFIDKVMEDATRIASLFEQAITEGQITQAQLFSRDYQPIAGTNPGQVMAPFTELTDRILPAVLEAALEVSDKVVFCAAVNLDGYLPTHNRKFSNPQGNDPEWNTAHCRNRRIFDDRVGLKAGRSAAPFLLQVYRRDMGGGVFKLMKDVSAPIMVQGRHWGGLRLAYEA